MSHLWNNRYVGEATGECQMVPKSCSIENKCKDQSSAILDEIAEEIFEMYSSLGLTVWYKVRHFEVFKQITMPDELLLILIESSYTGLRQKRKQGNLFISLMHSIPAIETLRVYVQPQTTMEGALFYICAMLHLVYAREFKLKDYHELVEYLFKDFLTLNAQSFVEEVLAILGLGNH